MISISLLDCLQVLFYNSKAIAKTDFFKSNLGDFTVKTTQLMREWQNNSL